MESATFDLASHAGEYQYDYVTVIDGIMSDEMCDALRARINGIIARDEVRLVDHCGLGTSAVSDSGGVPSPHLPGI